MLMREKRMSITDCAMESGFGSLRTFYRVFEEEFGCSPHEYLKQI
jgi:AraC-like DNA-binding protein